MTKIKYIYVSFVSLISLGLTSQLTEIDIKADVKQKKITRIIKDKISNYNFRNIPLNNQLSETILDSYLEDLDPNRYYFLKSDIKKFKRFEHKLDDYLKDYDISPGFVIFNRYKEQLNKQIDFALELLTKNFNFSINENYTFDRHDQKWAKTEKELDQIWRRRVKHDYLSIKLSEDKDDKEIKETLSNRYKLLRRRTNQLESDDIFHLFINSYATSVDPHTSYFSPRTSENFKIRMSLSLEGIGAVLEAENEYTKIRRIITGGPAEQSEALQSGDRIVGVGQDVSGKIVDVVGWRLDDVVDLIRGPKGSTVRLRVLPKGTGKDMSKVIEIVRDKIKLEEQAAKKEIMSVDVNSRTYKIGVITLPTFYSDFDARRRGDKDYRSTTRDVRRLLKEFKRDNINGILLDLRNNGGGALSEARELTGLFIKSGPIVQIKHTGGRIDLEHDPDPNLVYDGPLVVLVDRNSASASEILSGAIQDYKRGIIIGEPTYGKGTVQNLLDINSAMWVKENMGQLKMTIAQFFRINGDSTQHRGVVPDIIYPTAFNIDEHGERTLKNAIPWDSVKSARYEKYKVGINEALVDKLIVNHEQRIESDPGFNYLISQSLAINNIEKQKSISLVENIRRERADRLDKEHLARHNLYLSKIGKPVISSEEFLEKQEESEFALGMEKDVLLKEAVNIMADYLQFNPSMLADTNVGQSKIN